MVQPVLDLLGNNADFFVARGTQPIDLIALLLVLIFGLPLLLAIIYKLLSKISNGGLLVVHHFMVAILAGL